MVNPSLIPTSNPTTTLLTRADGHRTSRSVRNGGSEQGRLLGQAELGVLVADADLRLVDQLDPPSANDVVAVAFDEAQRVDGVSQIREEIEVVARVQVAATQKGFDPLRPGLGQEDVVAVVIGVKEIICLQLRQPPSHGQCRCPNR